MAIRDWLGIARTLDHLLQLDEKYRRLFEAVTLRLDAIDVRLARLETREEIVVAKAEAAAMSASTIAASHALADLARRLGATDERVPRVEGNPRRKRLPRGDG
jgi:hypothetical protein